LISGDNKMQKPRQKNHKKQEPVMYNKSQIPHASTFSNQWFFIEKFFKCHSDWGGSVAEWLACWTQAQKGPGSNRSRNAVG